MWVYVCVYAYHGRHVSRCGYIYVWFQNGHRYICMDVCMYMYIHLGVWTYLLGCVECVTVCILCVTRSSTSPSQSKGGLIKLSHDLKDFNFTVTFFRVS